MKTIKLNKIIMMSLLLIAVTSCVKNDDFETPNLNINEPNIDIQDVVNISFVSNALALSNESMYSFSTEKYMEGYVVSSDQEGNFFKNIIIQDAPENPTFGIKLLVDVSPLYTSYEVGRKVFIKLDALTVGTSNGVLTLGVRGGIRPERIPFSKREEHIIRSTEVATIVPKPITIEDFSNANTNLMVYLTDVQFKSSELSKSFASEPGDEFDGKRILESCESGNTAILNTSTRSSFKGLRVPSGRGDMSAILIKSFNGENFRLYINDPSLINFYMEERC